MALSWQCIFVYLSLHLHQHIQITVAVSNPPTSKPTQFGEFDCVTRISDPSGTGDYEQTSITCNEEETLTSCGFKAESALDETNRPGTKVYDSAKDGTTEQCIAQNMGLGVRAYARCCSFTSTITDISCASFSGPVSVGSIFISCNDTSHDYLLGCSALSPTNSLLGAYANDIPPKYTLPEINYPMYQECYSEDGLIPPPNGGSQPTMICCNSPSFALDCSTRYGSKSDSVYSTSFVACADGYAMTGCSGWIDSTHTNTWFNGWYIENDRCNAIGTDVYAIAICCKFETSSPTLWPSQAPTVPTVNPTPHPTLKGVIINPMTTPNPTTRPSVSSEDEKRNDMITTVGTDGLNKMESNTDSEVQSLWTAVWILIVLVILLLFGIIALIIYVIRIRKNEFRKTLEDGQELISDDIMMTEIKYETRKGTEPGTGERDRGSTRKSYPALPAETGTSISAIQPGVDMGNDEEKQQIEEDTDDGTDGRKDSDDDMYEEMNVTKGNKENENENVSLMNESIQANNIDKTNDSS